MFESAELGHKLSKEHYKKELPELREALLDAQLDLLQSRRFPVIILLAGVFAALWTRLGPRQPFPGRWYKAGVVVRADTVEELAEKIGVDAAGLAETVAGFNEMARTGVDADFHRGDSAYDRWSGDGEYRFTKASTLGRIDQAPFYAVPVESGTLGTSGGPRIDAQGRVLDTRLEPIPGLYAAGNVASAPTAMAYGGAGGTLGPILVFGRLAGLSAAAG